MQFICDKYLQYRICEQFITAQCLYNNNNNGSVNSNLYKVTNGLMVNLLFKISLPVTSNMSNLFDT